MRVYHLTGFIKTLVCRYRYPPYHALYRAAELQAIKEVFKDYRGCEIVIDAGCGDGTFFKMMKSFKQNLRKSFNVGIDISVLELRKAKRVYDDVILADTENLPIKKCCVNIVFSNSVAEHLHNPREFFIEVQRILEQRGCLVLTTVTDKFEAYSPKVMIYNYLHRVDIGRRVVKKYVTEFNHRWHFTRDTSAKLFIETNLRLKKAVTFVPPWLTVTYFVLYELNKYGERRLIRYLFFGLSLIIMWFVIIFFYPLQVTSKYGADMLVIGESKNL